MPKNNIRIASSEIALELFGDITRYQELLTVQRQRILSAFPDVNLATHFNALDTRIISLCPMVLCHSLLSDLSLPCPDDLLTGIGLSAFSISTHDDLVDELPTKRQAIAGLVYAGNIATLEGLKILIAAGYAQVAEKVIEYLNLNHLYQAKITSTLWKGPQDEKGYLAAIGHTKYWVAMGLEAAITFSGRNDLEPFVREFSECYGTTCQLGDDMREIKDDVKNGYWSLPIIIAYRNNWSLTNPTNLNRSIRRSRQLAQDYLKRAKKLCGDFPLLRDLLARIEKAGNAIRY